MYLKVGLCYSTITKNSFTAETYNYKTKKEEKRKDERERKK
jgi:hypothetical protein